MALHDEDERREVTYEEARAVLDAQRETLADMDTKAVRTVKITVVLLGVLLSAWRIESGLFDPALATLGGLTLVASIATGMVTYSESDLRFGPSKKYIERLADGDLDGHDWERHLLYNFGEWIASNRREIRVSSWFLSATQVLLLIGITLFGASVLL